MTEALVENRTEAARKSVTRDNAFPIDRGGGYFQILIPATSSQGGLLPAYLPPDFRQRERILDSTVRADAMWSAAIGIAITKAAALAWETKSESALKSKRAQELLLAADATSISGIGGWVSYMGKQVRNFTCTNGGCFTEIIRATGAYGSKIVGLGHLSSLRMRRTGDPEYPFIYMDRWGRQHVMRWWQVFNLVDMPDPDDSALGMGLCAAERAYQQIRKLSALETYLYEKISGSRPLALHIVNGLTRDQLTDMIQSASESQASKGLSMYMGAIVATTLKPDSPPALVTIPLAELPDGFEAALERDRADLIYANSLGLDPQDLKPISNQQMGAGAQSEVLNQKAEGRGQAAYRQQLTHMLNQLVFDDKTQFLFTEHDYRDQKAAADVSTARGAFISGLVEKQLISGQQGLQVLVEQGELPKAFIEQGAQAGSDLSDTDKPDVNEPLNDASGPPQPSNQPVMQTQTPTPTTAPSAASPAAATPVPAAPGIPARPKVPGAIVERKATGTPHHTQARHVQAGARRILRELQRRGGIHTKASGGVWRTIGGHPVLISGGGGGGSGGGGSAGSGASSGGGASTGASAKKPAKTYVPKPAAGGSSIYPTLDAYKKGTLSHADTLVALKQDIKTAKLAGNTKAVNSLTSHYYAIKNGPNAGAPATANTTLGGMGKPAPVAGPPKLGMMPPHEATIAAHKVTEAFVNDEISSSEMNTKLAAIGAQSGHTADQLKAMAGDHEKQLHAAGQSASLKNTPTAADLLKATGGTNTSPSPPASAFGPDAHAIMMQHAQGHLTAAEMGTSLDHLSSVTGVPKNDLIAAGKLHNQQLNVAAGKPATSTSKIAIMEGHPVHTAVMEVDNKIKAGNASQEDVAHAKNTIAQQITLEQAKVDAAAASTKSAHDAGIAPLPSVVKLHNDAQDKIEALHGMEKHIDASVGLYGLKKGGGPLQALGLSDNDAQTVVNINSLYDKGTIKLGQYDALMEAQAKKLGVSKGKLEQAIFDHNAGKLAPTGSTGPLTPAEAALAYQAAVNLHKGNVIAAKLAAGPPQSAAYPEYVNKAAVLKHDYDTNKIDADTYDKGLEDIAANAGTTPFVVKYKVQALQDAVDQQAASAGNVKLVPHHSGEEYYQIGSPEAAHTWGEQQTFAKPLTAREKKAVYDYSYQGDEAINAKLRFGTDLDYAKLHPAQEPARRDENIHQLDAIMARSSVPTNVQVHRGFSNPELIRRMTEGQPLEGAVFHDDGFVSTAVSTTSAFGADIRTHINVPKGSQGLYAAPHVKSSYTQETELLLPRGSNFKITGYRRVDTGFSSYWELDMDYLGPQEIPGAFKAVW